MQKLRLSCAAVLASMVVTPSVFAAPAQSCEKPVWPRESLRFEQEGKVTLAYLLDEDGAVRDWKVVKSSGFPLLDVAARDGMAKCRLTPRVKDGKPVAAWIRMQYVWTLRSSASTDRENAYAAASATQKAAIAAEADSGTPRAIELLTKAAVRGDVTAQLWQAARYEAGKGVPVDHVAAAAWYGRAAEAGDSTAAEALARLHEQGLGILPDPAAAGVVNR
ncbi:TonB family protein [Massilia dura]|uniref:TonB family protein n=1 Tax=Pseudoduganella dura TaxID=321982 RepID=A0A6I3XFC4_9BURK|nr:TonB family protein [Pseudoduganella dura]MUI13013.1 TonB family protein [Pseudoduganella dura]GGX87897.1 hypothetical protein GCM10007386_18430 [Pseudoduganella dura]